MTYFELFSKAKFVTRFSGLNLIQPERLESHIIEMIGLAMDLDKEFKGSFNLEHLVYLISIHDIDECVTVDIPRPFKYFTKEFREALDINLYKYLDSLGFEDSFIYEVSNAKKFGLEGRLLNLLDLFQVKLKLLTERSLGNSNLKVELNNIHNYIDTLYREDEELRPYILHLNKLINTLNL
jgi:5'-deoxynucleotidase YfbR-like HD superfamily hydrolase